MDSLYLILLALFLLVIIPRIMQRRRLAAIRHILNRKMRFAACGQHIRCLRGRVFTENALYFSSEVHKADSL